MEQKNLKLKKNRLKTEVKKDFDKLLDYDFKRDMYYFARRSRCILKELPKDKNINILDFGGGSGLFSLNLQKKGYKNIYLVDISESQSKLAEEKGLENVYYGDEDYLIKEFKNNFFDFVLMMDVIEHLENPYETLRKIKKVMNPEAKLLITYPNPLWVPIMDFLGNIGLKLKGKDNKIYFKKLKEKMNNDFSFISLEGHMLVSKFPQIILDFFEVVERVIPQEIKRKICILNVAVLAKK